MIVWRKSDIESTEFNGLHQVKAFLLNSSNAHCILLGRSFYVQYVPVVDLLVLELT